MLDQCTTIGSTRITTEPHVVKEDPRVSPRTILQTKTGRMEHHQVSTFDSNACGRIKSSSPVISHHIRAHCWPSGLCTPPPGPPAGGSSSITIGRRLTIPIPSSMAAAVRPIPAGLVPTLGRSRDGDGGVAASSICSIGRRQSFGDIGRCVDCRLSGRGDRAVGRGAAARDGFPACRSFCARYRAVLAVVVDDSGDGRAG